MTAPLPAARLAGARAAVDAYAAHPELGFACCSAHGAADFTAELVAEIERLTPAPKSPLTGVSVKDTGHGWQVRHRLYGKSRRPRNFPSKEAADQWVDQLRAKHAVPADTTKGEGE